MAQVRFVVIAVSILMFLKVFAQEVNIERLGMWFGLLAIELGFYLIL